ncbi:MAG: molybdenum cofactor biosynthesis protein [Holophagaceae bacterium]|nr:molybdenum cofactor biosynthesis protein [Holophagaceae bacterium]
MVTVLCFARYRELLGFDRNEFPLGAESTLGGLLSDPRFASLPKDALLAVNRTFVDRQHPLKDGDEVALMPPVSGG